MRSHLRALVAALAVVGALLGALGPAAPASAADPSPINGGGSGFAALELDQWRADTARKPFSLKVNYVSQGSTFGRQQFIDGNLDFGASDIVFLDSETSQLQSKRCGGKPLGSCFVYVPVSAGGLSLMYNLLDNQGQRVKDLKLTRRTACKVFTGAISKWNDPEIVATNPRLTTFARDIVPIVRGDGAGESYVFSQFCQAVAPDVWKAFIKDRLDNDPANVAPDFKAGKPVSNWPQGWGRANPALYADGVANTVADPVTGKNAITYTAAGYAKVRNFPVASLQNAANVFTQPDEENVTVALGYAKGRGDGTFDLNFGGADPRAYFPSTYSYVIAQTAGFDPGKGATLGRFLCYAVTKGQAIAPSLRYARLSSVLVQISIDAITRIPGAPSKADCPVAGAPPPPPPPKVTPGTTVPVNNPGNGTPGGGTPGGGTPGGGTPGAGAGSGTGSGAGAGTGSGSGTGSGTGTDGGAGAGSGLGAPAGGSATTEPDPLASAAGDFSGSPIAASGTGTGTGAGAGASSADGSGGGVWLVLAGAVLCMVGGAVGGRLRRAG